MDQKGTPPDVGHKSCNARLLFLENLIRIDQAIRQETNVEQMLWKATKVMLSVFDCDRAWLLYPCDPDASSWRIPVEITRPEYPGAFALNSEIPMTADTAEAMRQVLATHEPISGVLDPNEPQWDSDDKYGVRSYMLTAVHPKVGKPWELGLHQCSYPRVWTKEEHKLFKEIGHRIGDALSNILILRDLRESESLLKETQGLAQVGGWIWDVDAGTGVWTDEVYKIHEFPADLSINHFEKSLECYHPEDRPIIEKAFKQAIEEGKPYNLELRFITAKGNPRWVRTMANPVKVGNKVVKVTGNLMDITERRQAEEERKAHLHFLESLERINRAIRQETDVEQMLWVVVETIFKIFDCDRAWLMDPCDPEAPSFRVPVEICRPEYPGAEKLNIEVPMKPGADQVCAAALAANGPVIYGPQAEREVYKELTAQFGVLSQMTLAVYPKVGKPWLLGMHQCSHARIWTPDEQGLFNEIGRRIADGLSSVLFLRELQENEERFRATFEQAAVGVAHVAPDGRWLRVNRKLCDIVGYSREDLLKMTIQDITHPDDLEGDLDYLRQMLAEEISTQSMEKRYLRKDGLVVWINLTVSTVRQTSGDPMYFLYVVEDISERKMAEEEKEKLQRQLVQAQKMESVGRLAGGVAHDYNNMLSVIIGYADLALKKTDSAQPLHAELKQIHSAAKRSADITRQLLAFARQQTIDPKVLDLNEAVEGMLKMIRRLIGEDIDLAWLPKAGPGAVKMDPTQIDQILANLCVNARDAIAGVGKIIIETDNVVFDETYCSFHAGFEPGEYVMLSVADDGCGMEKEKLDHIFEPFFTTKGMGKGTGLGLATVYGIAKQNDGFINVYSEPEKGTTFRIYLPCYKDKIQKISSERPAKEIKGGSETILLVEDEPALLELGQEMLEVMGYRVLAAGTPGEAIRLAKEHGGQIGLLLTDVVMPEMDGRDLANRLLSLYPNLKRLYMSGHTANVISHRGVLEADMCFLQKPFSMEDLSDKVREALQKE